MWTYTALPQQPDTRPGAYYVSVRDGERYSLLAGPFPTHAEALARVENVRHAAEKLDMWAWFYQFGTCRVEGSQPLGLLNDQLGVVPQ